MRFSLSRHDARSSDQAVGVAVFLTMLAFLFQLTYTAAARGQEKDEAQASAALALAKAKREREQAKARASAAMSCHSDYDKAVAEAERAGKSLVLWVGVSCESHPELRRALGNAVHCHMKERRGQKEPGIVIMGGDGIEYVVRPEKIKPTTADKIKEAWRRPYIPPVRGDVRIVEEMSYALPVVYEPVVYVIYSPLPSPAAGFMTAVAELPQRRG